MTTSNPARNRGTMTGRLQPGASLRGERLVRQDLAGVDLSHADLTDADLSGCNLAGARLVGANLRGASLFEANLEGAELLGAQLQDANLELCRAARAGLGGVDATGASFFAADLKEACLSDARLGSADLRTADLRGARLQRVELAGAALDRADLRDVDLERADVADATLTDADLRRARVRGISGFETADWIGADVFEIDFTGAYLVRRHIQDENYLHEFRTRDRLSAVLHRIWWLTSDCGRSVSRWALWTGLFALGYALLYAGMDIDWGGAPTALSPLYFSVVTLTTLGYGDVLPRSAVAQAAVMSQVVIGYVLLGGLISIMSNKMARRAD